MWLKADPQSKVYGTTDPSFTYQIVSGSLVSGDSFSGSLSRVAGENVGRYVIGQGSLSLPSGYALTFIVDTLTITPRAIIVAANDTTKVYGTTDPALTYAIVSGSLVSGDNFTGSLTRVAGENVGQYVIGQGSLALSSNYSLMFVNDTFTVTPRPITVTADAKAKAFGAADPVLTYQITSGTLFGTDTFSGSLVRVAGEAVGKYPINQGSLSLGSNYTLTYVHDTLTIGTTPIVVKADLKSKVYGSADPSLTYSIVSGSLVSGDSFSGSLTRVAGENVGRYVIGQGSLSLPSGYALTFIVDTLTITPRAITVAANDTTKVYGTTDPSLTYAIVSGSLVSGDNFTGSLTRVAGENVGQYVINQGSLALNSNYLLTYIKDTLTITPRPITVTADAKTKAFGAADPVLTYQITSGTLFGTDTFSGSLVRVAGEAVGKYPINQGSLSLGSNYTLTYVHDTLTIGTTPIVVKADPQSKVYGTTDPSLTYSIVSGSLVSGDSFSGSLTRVAGENVGRYVIGQGSLSLPSGYALTFIVDTLTITPRAIIVAANDTTKVYGTTDPALTYAIVSGSLVSGDNFTGSLTRVAGENVGQYLINQGSLALSSNYALTYIQDTLSITPRAITVTADAKAKAFGAADPALTYQITSGTLFGTDTFSGSLVRVAGEAVGKYPINQGSLSLGSNYTLTYVHDTLTIGTTPIVVKADPQSKVYGSADPSLTYSIVSGSLVSGIRLVDR